MRGLTFRKKNWKHKFSQSGISGFEIEKHLFFPNSSFAISDIG
jgi:hypothetical protein